MNQTSRAIRGMILFSLMGLASGTGRLWAEFTSIQIATISMECTVGGEISPILPSPFQILHAPLRGISPISKIAIIEGTTGTGVRTSGPGLRAVSSKSVRAQAGPPVIRVSIRYRFMGTPENPLPGTIVSVPPLLYDTNPTVFSLQLDPGEIQEGEFNYQIRSEHLDIRGVVLSSAAVPSAALTNPNGEDSWIKVGSGAGQALVQITSLGGSVILSDGNPRDGESSIAVPAGVFRESTGLSLTEMSVFNPAIPSYGGWPRPLAMYRMDAQPPFMGGVLIRLLYPENVPTLQGWDLTGPVVDENVLSLAIWDGYRWKNIGGRVDSLNNLMTSQVGYVNYLGIFPVMAASGKELATFQKIITPYGDNQTADFTGVTSPIEIFDINGHRVRTIPAAVASWDGRDDDGKIVESGVYIFQFKDSGETVSGVIAVAK